MVYTEYLTNCKYWVYLVLLNLKFCFNYSIIYTSPWQGTQSYVAFIKHPISKKIKLKIHKRYLQNQLEQNRIYLPYTIIRHMHLCIPYKK